MDEKGRVTAGADTVEDVQKILALGDEMNVSPVVQQDSIGRNRPKRYKKPCKTCGKLCVNTLIHSKLVHEGKHYRFRHNAATEPLG